MSASDPTSVPQPTAANDHGDGALYEVRQSDSPFLECTYQARAVKDERYLVPATEHWDIWFGREANGEVSAGLSGPSLGHRWVVSAVGQHGWGVQLRSHMVVLGVSKRLLLGGEIKLPVVDGRVELAGQRLTVPEFDDLGDFVGGLVARGALRSDDDLRRALSGDESGYSERHWQRRARETTGMTRKQIAQIVRARRAFELLQQGLTPAECAVTCGYSDQAHLTRSLGVFHGMTPARILVD